MVKKVLDVKNLSKKFGKFTAVDNISFDIKEGEIVGLLGPNGAGKTTTIQMLLGTLTSTSGEVKYFDKDFSSHREEILRNINFCSSYIRLPWRMTVYENLDVIAKLYGVKNSKEKIYELLEIFDITKLKDRTIASLSAGQVMRAVLAKAFINSPKLMLLDEPTASLDPDIAQKIRDFLLKQQKENKLSMLFTSHNMAEVEELCDRVIFLNKGKILAEDTPIGLAKRLKTSKVELLIEKEMSGAIKICEQNGWKAKAESKYLNIRIGEDKIADLLKKLAEAKINYIEITIDKPNLHDYFLSVARKEKDVVKS